MDEESLRASEEAATKYAELGRVFGVGKVQELIAEIRRLRDENARITAGYRGCHKAHEKALKQRDTARGTVDELLEGDPVRWGGPCYLCHRSTEHADDCAVVRAEQERDWGPEDSSGNVLRIGAGGGWVWVVRGE